MNIVDKLFQAHIEENRQTPADVMRAMRQVQELLALAKELEAHCEAMAAAMRDEHGGMNYEGECPECYALGEWQKFKQEHTK